MTPDGNVGTLAEVLARYRAGQISRRTVARMLGTMGLAGAAALRTGRFSQAASLQDGTPAAGDEPPPPATPILGERADGTLVWKVQVGAMDEAVLVEAMGFFPQEITVNVGDSIFFDNRGFHTITFLSGQERPFLFVSEESLGTPAAEPRFVINPMAGFPVGGDTYDGTSYVNSGTPDPSAPPFTLTFTAPGSFDYLCLVHPQMQAKVIVQEAGAELPMDQAGYDQLGTEQAEALLDEGRALVSEHASATPTPGEGAGVHEVLVGVGGEYVEVLQYFPRELTVQAGDTVRWTYTAKHEPHTVTFLGDAEPPELILVEPAEGGPPTLVLNPLFAREVEGADAFDGEGFASSSTLGDEMPEFSEDIPRSATYDLTFDEPGEYRYYCVYHSGGPDDEHGMVGTVIVT